MKRQAQRTAQLQQAVKYQPYYQLATWSPHTWLQQTKHRVIADCVNRFYRQNTALLLTASITFLQRDTTYMDILSYNVIQTSTECVHL